MGIVKSGKSGKCYRSGDHFIHSDLSYRGVILYHWPGQLVRDGQSTNEKFYQVLVDQRDAEELPMEHELLRISDADREAVDFTPTRFKNWDLVRHSEVMKYKPMDTGLAVKHHLMHHFLKSFYSYKNGMPSWEVKRTPTLNYWRKKFSGKPVVCHEADAQFSTLVDGENSDLEVEDLITISVIPYHLTTNSRSNINVIGHLARFYSNTGNHYKIIERIVLAENPLTGEICESSMTLDINLGGVYNSIYQHSRHIDIPHGESNLVFVFRVQRVSDEKESELVIPAFSISSNPADIDSDI